jgi:hypothetical protein
LNITTHPINGVAAAPEAPRLDMYAGIHKALRALMADTLLALGRMDADDALELAQTSQRVMELLDFCTSHLQHENEFVHAAIEARAPGASKVIAHEHEEHEQHITRLRFLAGALLKTAAPQRATAVLEPQRAAVALELYRQLALFIAENFHHMQVEETAHNAVLWSCYTDVELAGIQGALVAAIPPEQMMYTLRWLIPFMNPGERTAMMADMQALAPAPAFAAALDVVRPHLSRAEWGKLVRSLGLAAVPELVSA